MVPRIGSVAIAAVPRSTWLALGGAAALVVPTLVAPDASGPVLCPLRRVTGVWCPGCGMTRAIGWLVHGDLAESWRYHPWAAVVVAQVAFVGGWLLWRRRGAIGARSAAPTPPWLVPVALSLNAVALVGIWIFRLKSGAFDRLA